jgi:hypothetical protein
MRLRVTVHQKVALGISFLVCGCAIYLLFRSKTLNIYNWCSALGLSTPIDTLRIWVQNWNIPEFVRFCLPDGLYCAAYILFIDAIWHKDKSIIKNIIVLLVPLVTISSELLQLFGIVRGTFDIYDLVCYTFPLLVYLSIICYQHYTVKMLKQTCV